MRYSIFWVCIREVNINECAIDLFKRSIFYLHIYKWRISVNFEDLTRKHFNTIFHYFLKFPMVKKKHFSIISDHKLDYTKLNGNSTFSSMGDKISIEFDQIKIKWPYWSLHSLKKKQPWNGNKKQLKWKMEELKWKQKQMEKIRLGNNFFRIDEFFSASEDSVHKNIDN